MTGDEPPGNGPVTSSSRGLPAEREENAGPIRPRARAGGPFSNLTTQDPDFQFSECEESADLATSSLNRRIDHPGFLQEARPLAHSPTSLSCRCADGSSVTLFDDGVVAGAMAGMMIAPPADPRCRGVPAGVWPIPTGAAEPSRPDRHLPCCRNAISTSIGSWAHRDHHRGLSASERPRVDGAKMQRRAACSGVHRQPDAADHPKPNPARPATVVAEPATVVAERDTIICTIRDAQQDVATAVVCLTVVLVAVCEDDPTDWDAQ